MKSMKKAFSLIALSLLIIGSNPAKASPVQEKIDVVDNAVIYDAPIFAMKYEAVADLNFYPAIDQVYVEHPIQSATIQLPATVMAEDQLAPDERIRLYRHYFDPEDNKKYPEYRPDKLCSGFTRPVDRPAR